MALVNRNHELKGERRTNERLQDSMAADARAGKRYFDNLVIAREYIGPAGK
jgi:hypothetical protein